MIARVFMVVLMLAAGSFDGAAAQTLPANERPLFGGIEKTDAMKQADSQFIASVEQMGYTRAQGARKSVEVGWAAFAKGDVASAIRRFNQAWLLDPEFGDAFHGFAVVTAARGGPMDEAETYFRTAVAKPGVSYGAHVDYGRFLNMQRRSDEAIRQAETALKLDPKARNARAQMSFAYMNMGKAAEACAWADQAAEHGDPLEPGYRDHVCKTMVR